MPRFRTASPASGYGGEALLAHVEDGRLVRVEGDPDDRFARGRLSAFAGHYVERLNGPDRLLRPLVRRTRDDPLEPATWDEALERIRTALSAAARQHDPRAVLYHTGHGHDGVMARFGELFLSYFGGWSSVYGDLCRAAGMEATRLTFGALRHHPPEDLANSGMIVVWGKNPAVTCPAQMRFLEEARAAGARLVCIDPIRTETAALSDEHLAPRPGTDGFLAHAIACVLLEEGLHDEAFVRDHVLGFEDYRSLVRQCEPRKAERVCGVPAERIVGLAREFGSRRPVNVAAGFGLQRYRNGGQTVRAVAALQAIAGNIGVKGGGFDFFNEDAFVARPYPFRMPAQPRVRQLGAASRLGRITLDAQAPPVVAAILERSNPIAQTPNAAAVHYALRRLDFVCAIDLWLTDTAQRADVVLPAKSMFEETDIVQGPWDGVIRLKPKCVDPPAEARTEREIYRSLAALFGYPTEQFDLDPVEMIDRVLPAGLSANRLRKQPFARHGPAHVPFADRRFPTPSGRVEIRSTAAEISWRVDPLPLYVPSRESEQNDPERFKRYPLHLVTPKTRDRHCSQLVQPGDPSPPAPLLLHPADARARGIATGNLVRVFNDRGEASLKALVDDAVRQGVVMLPQGRWISRDGLSANVFTHDDATDMGHGAVFFDCLVQVEKNS
ncbi:MAG: molybdopterin-dependent oxidoreductase [Planctomycetes bacterium]|nr:molybdopterin-dependent oxidoreductase [Planctomycetota bacterium]